MSGAVELNKRPKPDGEMVAIADYVGKAVKGKEAFDTARWCLLDTLGCGMLALKYPECRNLLGPVEAGTKVPKGARVPGTKHVLDVVTAAFNIGCMVRWLDYNDTWLAAEWGHPSDNLGSILAIADNKNVTMKDVLSYMIKAHEIQGVMALENSFNRVGLDHVALVKLASAAVAAHMLGADKNQIIDTISHVWVDGQSLRTYRHSPNAGPRKSWAAGDATSRAVLLALRVLKGQIGYPSALTAPKWGFYDVSFKGEKFKFQRKYGSYVMENVLFKISYPAEFHSQTAVEAAIRLHPQIKNRLNDIERIELTTHESAIRIISKTGKLYNFADRDHCLQYMVAIGLLKGDLTADDYTDKAAKDPRIDKLRDKMVVQEDKRYSTEYHEPEKRSIANAVQVFFKDGSKTEKVEIEYPVGHRRRRKEGIPLLKAKARANLATQFPKARVEKIMALFENQAKLEKMKARDFMKLFVK